MQNSTNERPGSAPPPTGSSSGLFEETSGGKSCFFSSSSDFPAHSGNSLSEVCSLNENLARRKSSIEMFLSQSPSQALGQNLMKLNLDSSSSSSSFNLSSDTQQQQLSPQQDWRLPLSNTSSFYSNNSYPQQPQQDYMVVPVQWATVPITSSSSSQQQQTYSSNSFYYQQQQQQTPPPPLPIASPPLSPQQQQQHNNLKQCKFYLNGHCRMGSKCKFSHHHHQHHQQHQQQPQQQPPPAPPSLHHHQHKKKQMDLYANPPPLHHQQQHYHQHHHHQKKNASLLPPPPPPTPVLSPPPPIPVSTLSSPTSSSSSLGIALTTDKNTTLSPELIRNRVFAMSKDQNGCRLLQEQLDLVVTTTSSSLSETNDLIYSESLPHLSEMMVDPFGNYLFQKLLERVSTSNQRFEMVRRVASNLVAAALNLHGTRSVQKVVEICSKSSQLVQMIVSALKNDAVRLCIDSNGNHVIQRALQFMSPLSNQFVFDAVSSDTLTVGTHRHGCCVLQRCLDAADPIQKTTIIQQVENHCMKLMQDPYGNYVVQYVLDSCSPQEAAGVITKPLINVFELSIQKFSSNVIEKCLEKASPRIRELYIKEIIKSSTKMSKMLQDQFANYVVQRALSICTEEQGYLLVSAIRPHLNAMKNTSGGRRITARILKRFPTIDLGLDPITTNNAIMMEEYDLQYHYPNNSNSHHHHHGIIGVNH